jgi:hypothetical protein
MATEEIRPCLTCGGFVELRTAIQGRCATCAGERKLAGKFGSLLVQGAMTQREVADLKREFYSLYQIDKALEARKFEFMQKAQEEMNRVIAEVEAQVGQPMKELRARKQQLEAQLKAFMEESKNSEVVIRDLLVEVKEAMINRGNMPQYKAIVEDLRTLLKWSEDEMETFVRQHYSQPQYGNVMTVKPLPPGRRKKQQQQGPVASRTAVSEDNIAETIVSTHKTAGGGTFDIHGHDLSGQPLYAVPLYPERTAILHRELTVEDIENFIDANADLLADARNKIGTWLDSETGEHVLDVVVAIPNRRLAIELGTKYNQKAIYDLGKMEEIRTGGNGQPIPDLPDPAERLPAPMFGDEGYAEPSTVELGDVKAYHTPYLDLPTTAAIHSDFLASKARVCKVTTPDKSFIFTGERVRENGLMTMIAVQSKLKATLKVIDVENRRDGNVHVLLEGAAASDPNTVRAFLAERIEDHEIGEVFYDSPTRVAIELRPITKQAGVMDAAVSYFDTMLETVQNLMQFERKRMETAQQIMGGVTAAAGATQVQRPDNDEDLQMAYERAQPAGGRPGSFGDGTRADGGVMGPNDVTQRNSA